MEPLHIHLCLDARNIYFSNVLIHVGNHRKSQFVQCTVVKKQAITLKLTLLLSVKLLVFNFTFEQINCKQEKSGNKKKLTNLKKKYISQVNAGNETVK